MELKSLITTNRAVQEDMHAINIALLFHFVWVFKITSLMSTWRCKTCDLINNSSKTKCVACFTINKEQCWKCNQCFVWYNKKVTKCIACFNIRTASRWIESYLRIPSQINRCSKKKMISWNHKLYSIIISPTNDNFDISMIEHSTIEQAEFLTVDFDKNMTNNSNCQIRCIGYGINRQSSHLYIIVYLINPDQNTPFGCHNLMLCVYDLNQQIMIKKCNLYYISTLIINMDKFPIQMYILSSKDIVISYWVRVINLEQNIPNDIYELICSFYRNEIIQVIIRHQDGTYQFNDTLIHTVYHCMIDMGDTVGNNDCLMLKLLNKHVITNQTAEIYYSHPNDSIGFVFNKYFYLMFTNGQTVKIDLDNYQLNELQIPIAVEMRKHVIGYDYLDVINSEMRYLYLGVDGRGLKCGPCGDPILILIRFDKLNMEIVSLKPTIFYGGIMNQNTCMDLIYHDGYLQIGSHRLPSVFYLKHPYKDWIEQKTS